MKRTAEVQRDAKMGEAEARKDAGVKVTSDWLFHSANHFFVGWLTRDVGGAYGQSLAYHSWEFVLTFSADLISLKCGTYMWLSASFTQKFIFIFYHLFAFFCDDMSANYKYNAIIFKPIFFTYIARHMTFECQRKQ